MTGDFDQRSRRISRRAALKAFVGMGLAAGLTECVPPPDPGVVSEPAGPAANPPEPVGDVAPSEPGPAEEHDHPADGDLFVFALGDRQGQVITPEDVPEAGPQIIAYPMEPGGSHVGSMSRLDQVILLRLDPSELTEQTLARSAGGIVAYSAVCTHTGCDVEEWDEETRHLVCPCHESEFDPSDNARVVFGPAPRRLPALPVKVVDGVLTAAGGFTSRVGFQRG